MSSAKWRQIFLGLSMLIRVVADGSQMVYSPNKDEITESSRDKEFSCWI